MCVAESPKKRLGVEFSENNRAVSCFLDFSAAQDRRFYEVFAAADFFQNARFFKLLFVAAERFVDWFVFFYVDDEHNIKIMVEDFGMSALNGVQI